MGLPDVVDAEKKEMDVGTSDESTITNPTDKEKEVENTADVTPDYPQGLRLVVVLVAIVFSVFLLALDQVSTENPQLT